MTEQLDTPALSMAWTQAPWDEAVCGYPVVQISKLMIKGAGAAKDFEQFEKVRDRIGAGLVSCRLSHEHLPESMLLEDRGFRFIEMMYAPELDLPAPPTIDQEDSLLLVERACSTDLPVLLEIAGSSFQNERFRMDPRLAPGISDKRYQNWVAGSLDHPRQRLHAVRDRDRLVAFFVTEMLEDGTCYWHLNAISPAMQGQGYGRRVWCSMIALASHEGAIRIRTSIAARNHRVLNLYARLGFSFPPPSMTFHWVRQP